jgi:hypothetical protein
MRSDGVVCEVVAASLTAAVVVVMMTVEVAAAMAAVPVVMVIEVVKVVVEHIRIGDPGSTSVKPKPTHRSRAPLSPDRSCGLRVHAGRLDALCCT